MQNKYYVSGREILIYKSEYEINENNKIKGIAYVFDSFYRQGISVIIPCFGDSLKFISNLDYAINLSKKNKNGKL